MCNRWCPVKCCLMYYVPMWVSIPGGQAEFLVRKSVWVKYCTVRTQSNALISIFSLSLKIVFAGARCVLYEHTRDVLHNVTINVETFSTSLGNHRDLMIGAGLVQTAEKWLIFRSALIGAAVTVQCWWFPQLMVRTGVTYALAVLGLYIQCYTNCFGQFKQDWIHFNSKKISPINVTYIKKASRHCVQ